MGRGRAALPRPGPNRICCYYMARGDHTIEPDPIIEAYKRDVDVTLIRENLQRSVDERFERLMALQRFAEELRRAGYAARRQ